MTNNTFITSEGHSRRGAEVSPFPWLLLFFSKISLTLMKLCTTFWNRHYGSYIILFSTKPIFPHPIYIYCNIITTLPFFPFYIYYILYIIIIQIFFHPTYCNILYSLHCHVSHPTYVIKLLSCHLSHPIYIL